VKDALLHASSGSGSGELAGLKVDVVQLDGRYQVTFAGSLAAINVAALTVSDNQLVKNGNAVSAAVRTQREGGSKELRLDLKLAGCRAGQSGPEAQGQR